VLEAEVLLEDLVTGEDLPIKSTPSKFWRCPKESQGTRRFRCARFNEANTQKKKLPRKEKN
jgi:hypothetical protein